MAVAPLPTVLACDLEAAQPDASWLIRQVWVAEAVGMLGGQPKLGKSWLGLDMAISVASGTPCLGRFPVDQQGPALVFLAEDALGAVRARIDALCAHRGLDLRRLPLHVITAPVLRLDLAAHQQSLHATLNAIKPRLLVLDPLVRLHRLDENSSSDMSGLLGFLRELQRTHHAAIALVHHASKRSHARPGQSLRGSSDLHAFVDSLAYLDRRDDELLLHLEHRSAPSPEPFPLRLVHGPGGHSTHLQVLGGPAEAEQPVPLQIRVMDLLDQAEGPMLRKDLRERLHVNNQRLGEVMDHLLRQGRAIRTDQGWARKIATPDTEPSPGPGKPHSGAGAPKKASATAPVPEKGPSMVPGVVQMSLLPEILPLPPS